MIKNVLLAPNSFKECADSVEITAIVNSILENRTNLNIILKPLSDGGDGFLNVSKSLFRGIDLTYFIKNCYKDYLENNIVQINKNHSRIYIESADLIGLKVVPKEFRNPIKLNSENIGSILVKIEVDVLNQVQIVEEVIIGIGGTATLDFGIGACSRFGLKLLDENENELDPIPQNFALVSKIIWKKKVFPFKIKCVVDVDTELIGSPGALEIYGKQKGASGLDIIQIKNGIENILNILKQDSNIKVPDKINGAGGGIAAGLNIFLNAEIIRAEDFIKNYILKDIDFSKIDAVITGEGSFDYQSFEGKGVSVILNLSKNFSLPVFLICGTSKVPDEIKLPDNVIIINISKYFSSVDESIKNYREGLIKATEEILAHLHN